MKLKHILLTAVMALFAVSASAANAEDIKIYINPGHGSWGPNNRHMATLGGHETISTADPDTTDFYESNTNLWKCLEMFHRLRDYGFKNETGKGLDLTQNVVMSRIETGPYPYVEVDGVDPDQNNAYNRTLSVIAAEVEAYGADMFISVHSNANTEGSTVNYPIYLYRGYDNLSATTGLTTEIQTTSVAMAKASWPYLYEISHMVWSATSTYTATKPNIRGDINFMGISSTSSLGYTGYYGVMKHGVPGFLVEGYFHTYQPARHRAMNSDVCRIEGLAYARGIADYFGVANNETTGNIYGIVRDEHEKFSDALYTPRAGTDDVYKPLNGVEVMLKQGENVVATYTTDGNYNGAFVFRNVAPGDYTLEFAHADYKTIDPVAVTVAAATNVYPKAFLESTTYEPPAVVYVNYPDSTAGKSEYMLYPNYKLKAAIDNVAIAELEGKTIRRTIIRNGKAYILAHDASKAPSVYVYDIATQAVVKTLGTAAAVGDIYTISDIALTADGYLVGVNKANQAYGGANNMKAYKWEKDDAGLPDGEVTIWWENNFAGNWGNGIGGESCYYAGTLEDGQFVYTGTTTASNGNTRIIYCTISDGKYIGHLRNNQDGSQYMQTSSMGETYNITLSPRADDQWVINSDKSVAVEYQKNPADVGVPTNIGVMSEVALAVASANESYFKYAGRDLMVAPDINADGQVQGIKLFDITDGLANAVEIATNATITPTAYTYASAHGELALTLATDEKSITAADIQLYLVVDGKITKWIERTVSAAAPATGGTANPFAYALESEVANNTLNISYSLNAAAADVNIIIKNEAGEEVATSAEGALAAGAHTAEIALDGLENGTYTWSIEVAGEEKSGVQQFISHSFYHPGGLAVDNSMESASFGTLFVAEGYSPSSVNASYVDNEANVSGLYIFDPLGNQVLSNAGKERFYGAGLTFDKTLNTSNVGDLIRVAVASDGRIFVARGSDSGDYILYAESLEKLRETGELTSLLTGQTMTSTCVYNDASGNFMLGPVQAMDIYGEGENTKLLVQTRISNDNATYVYSYNRMFEYKIGTGTTLPTPTAVSALDQKYTIGFNKTLTVKYDNEGGIWYCQYRGTPTNAQPALVYVNAAGEIKFFEGDGGPSRRSGGMDVSVDGKYLAAISAPGQVTVYEIMKGADGTVALREEYIMTTGGNNMYDLAWDAAGNLYGANASTEYVRGYAIPRAEPFETKAASKYAFSVTASGVEAIGADVDADVPAIYYNLQGVQVENPENGIYIVKRGNKVTKEYIRR